jgi:sulfate/thiosulfate transport system substrate-binding protein
VALRRGPRAVALSTGRAMRRYAPPFPQLRRTTIEDFGGWTTARATHFKAGGVFDQPTAP